MQRVSIPVLICLLAAACATPQERCISDTTKELRTINSLIAETEGNLSRGYAIERETQVRPRLTFCAGSYRHRRIGAGVSFCSTDDIVQRERPVALDPQAERRKLAQLRERRSALEVQVRRDLAACSAV